MEASLGARLFANSPSDVGMVIKIGQDFPNDALTELQSWATKLDIIQVQDQPSARGRIEYSVSSDNESANSRPGEREPYQRLTAPLNVTPEDLQGTPNLQAQAFHFFDKPAAVEEQIHTLLTLRSRESALPKPFIIWEPHPRSCTPENLSAHQSIANLVDVFSPNHHELAAFFPQPKTSTFSPHLIESQARKFLSTAPTQSNNKCLLIRAAEHGSLLLTTSSNPPVWLPAFHPPDSGKVVDPTGAGNAFLGALVLGWLETGDWIEAAKFGAVAASFVIEQVGAPGVVWAGDGGRWNGENVRVRLGEYAMRVGGEAGGAS